MESYTKFDIVLSHHEINNYVFIYSSGRDRVLILWDISSGTSIRVLPVYESIEGAFIVNTNTLLSAFLSSCNPNDIYVASAGEKGILIQYNLFFDYINASNKEAYNLI